MKKRNLFAAAATIGAAAVVANTAKAGSVGPVLAVIVHPVKDFAAWKVAYDAAEPIRQKAGVTGAEVFHDPKDANMCVVIHRFPTVDAAQAFLGNPGLKDAMMKCGVTAPPVITIAVAA